MWIVNKFFNRLLTFKQQGIIIITVRDNKTKRKGLMSNETRNYYRLYYCCTSAL